MKRTHMILTIALSLAWCTAGLAADSSTQVFDAHSALEALKALEGDWIGTPASGGSRSGVRYEVIAGGNTVVKTYAPGKDNEMLTIYHMDGDALVLTHYCALNNQPRMRFEVSDTPGEIRFAFDGGTNFDPEVDAHAHEGWTRIGADGTIETESIGYSDGKPTPARRTVLRRR